MAYTDDSKLSVVGQPCVRCVGDTVLAVGRDGGEAVLQVEPLLVLLQRLSGRKDDEGLAVERSQSLVGLCSASRDRHRRSVANWVSADSTRTCRSACP